MRAEGGGREGGGGALLTSGRPCTALSELNVVPRWLSPAPREGRASGFPPSINHFHPGPRCPANSKQFQHFLSGQMIWTLESARMIAAGTKYSKGKNTFFNTRPLCFHSFTVKPLIKSAPSVFFFSSKFQECSLLECWLIIVLLREECMAHTMRMLVPAAT